MHFQVDHSENANMTAIFFSKYIIQTSKTDIANVVLNYVICSVREKITNYVCCISSDSHTTLILGQVTVLQ